MDDSGAFLALGGVLVGGLIAYVNGELQASRQRRWEVTRHKRDKLEELSALIDEIEHSYRVICSALMTQLATDGDRQLKSANRLPTARLSALVEFYAPELSTKKDELIGRIDTFGSVLVEVISSQNLNLSEKKGLLQKVQNGQSEISDACRKMANLAAQCVRLDVEREVTTSFSQVVWPRQLFNRFCKWFSKGR